ncbi:MAG: HAD-IA family hydrolase [Spirochaetaceae bacterium]|jgi:putative hydrolase of the HAD superfamily|nr:HAD-IA family hydrolase [Spirochaetaceae bacterium]
MIRHVLFDLDNTLYSSANRMKDKMVARMARFVGDFLGVSPEEARKKMRASKEQFGTTLEWLQAEHGYDDPQGFFAAVHPEEELADLQPDPGLRGFLLSLGLPMTVLTNAPGIHAQRVLDFFNIADIFLNVFDVEKNNLRGKPNPSAYLNAVEPSGFSVAETLFADDSPEYLRGFQDLGGRTVLVSDKFTEPPPGLGCKIIRSIYELPGILN